MAVNPFVLLPLYIYPEAGLWDPLFTAASTYPNVNFQVIVNPWTGPGEGDCPDESFTTAMQQIHEHANIKTLGYVHTANSWDCGQSGTDICVTSAPIEELKANVTKYQNWGSQECGNLPVDGIFFDESPSLADQDQISYMREASSFAKNTLTHAGKITMFNAGTGVESNTYWDLADYICVLENSGSEYDGSSTDDLTAGGKYADQATYILYNYEGDQAQLQQDVQAIFGEGIAGLSVTDTDGYISWSDNWMQFVGAVDAVVNGGQ